MAQIRVSTKGEIGRIDRNIYGHFLEGAFYGNIEGGVFDEGSPLSNDGPGALNGTRRDVIDACRELGLPVVRWPGGNYTSSYKWEDGIGPRDERPRRLDLNWGDEDSNRFGTDEFLAWCEAVDSQPYLAHSCRSVDDAIRWVEYTNYGGDTDLTQRRARNGRKEPWKVRYWGVGNEVYGPWQVGHRTAEQYARDALEHARFMRKVDPDIQLVAVGLGNEDWTRHLLEKAGPFFDYISKHLYGGSHHLFTGDDVGNFEAMVAQSIHFEQELRAFSDMVSTLARKGGVDRPLSLALDEWNMRHLEPASWPEPERGQRGGIAPRETDSVDLDRPLTFRVNRYSPRTLADALFYAGVFHTLQRTSGLDVAPTMANTVNLVNANGLLEVRPEGLVKSATYHVWKLLQKQTGSIAVHSETESLGVTREIRRRPVPDAHGQFASRPGYVPYLDVSASLSDERSKLHLSVINRHPKQSIASTLILDDSRDVPRSVTVHDLGTEGNDLLTFNTMDHPEAVSVHDRGEVPLEDNQYAFPPHSLSVLTFRLD